MNQFVLSHRSPLDHELLYKVIGRDKGTIILGCRTLFGETK